MGLTDDMSGEKSASAMAQEMVDEAFVLYALSSNIVPTKEQVQVAQKLIENLAALPSVLEQEAGDILHENEQARGLISRLQAEVKAASSPARASNTAELEVRLGQLTTDAQSHAEALARAEAKTKAPRSRGQACEGATGRGGHLRAGDPSELHER